jgi:hypothetical protein
MRLLLAVIVATLLSGCAFVKWGDTEQFAHDANECSGLRGGDVQQCMRARHWEQGFFGPTYVGGYPPVGITRGHGKVMPLTDRSYEEIWRAAITVADAHFEIREQNSATGIITAWRTRTAVSNGAWVGIYIEPATAGAPSYRVEAVSRKKAWEEKVLRDMWDVLSGRAMQ